MIRSETNRHVIWLPDGAMFDGWTMKGGWYWLDETMKVGSHEPLPTEQEAIGAFELYAASLR